MGAKAVVLEIDGDSAVVLREGGEFLRVPLRGRRWQVGQEVVLDPVPARRSPWRRLIVWSAAAALLVGVFSGFLVTPAAAQPAGYVTVDLDPARVGLVTDAWAVVLGVEPLTREAVALVEPVAWAGVPVDRAIVGLIERALGQPGMQPGVVVIAAAPLAEGLGLPPAVRQAVGRAQWGTARLLDRGAEPAAAAVVTVEDPEVGVRLAQLARRTGMSLFQVAALLGARIQQIGGVQAGGEGPEAVRRALAELADLPPEQLHRAWSAAPSPGVVADGAATAGGAAAPGPGSRRVPGQGRPASPSGRGAAADSAAQGGSRGPAAAGAGDGALPSPVIGLQLVDLLGRQIDGIVRGLLLLRPIPAEAGSPSRPATEGAGRGRGGAEGTRGPGMATGRPGPAERGRGTADGGDGGGRGRGEQGRAQRLADDRSAQGTVQPAPPAVRRPSADRRDDTDDRRQDRRGGRASGGPRDGGGREADGRRRTDPAGGRSGQGAGEPARRQEAASPSPRAPERHHRGNEGAGTEGRRERDDRSRRQADAGRLDLGELLEDLWTCSEQDHGPLGRLFGSIKEPLLCR